MKPMMDLFIDLAEREVSAVSAWLQQQPRGACVAWLVEAARLLDYENVRRTFGRHPQTQPDPDFDIQTRGWNSLVAMALSESALSAGVPMRESTAETLRAAGVLLHQLGRAVLLMECVEMMRAGVLVAARRGDAIGLGMHERTRADHFLDRVEHLRLADLDVERGTDAQFEEMERAFKPADLEDKLASLVFPWDSGKGIMVGYDADPKIDNYFLALAGKTTINWRDAAGIHPDSEFWGVSGADVTAVGLFLASIHLKHIRLVDAAKRKHPEINYAMSLSIWKPKGQLERSIADFTEMPVKRVAAALRLFAATSADSEYFRQERTPYFPMLIEVSSQHWLAPVSSIFKNVFQGVRTLQASKSSRIVESVNKPREAWMVSDLIHLFQGTRFRRIDRPTKISRNGAFVTDIDTAVADVTDGSIALFQLKWQDWDTNDVRRQRSRARNFVEQVDAWATAVDGWVAEFGVAALCQCLRLPAPKAASGAPPVRLFAIGRSAARFRSYGYAHAVASVAVCTWPQFVRLRYETGPVAQVIQVLYSAIRAEQTSPPPVVPWPHEITVAGQRIVLDDLWNILPEGE